MERFYWSKLTLVFGFLLIKGFYAANVEVSPSEALVLPGQNVTFLCRVAAPLQYCRFEIPGENSKNLNLQSSGKIRYYGSGLPSGQCGVIIDNVEPKHNGKIKCTLGMEQESNEYAGQMDLIVAREPRQPEMELSRGSDNTMVYKVSEIVQASCHVKDGRPVANISWFIDDEPIYDGLSMPTVYEQAKENLQSKFQNLTRQLRTVDNGRKLRCVAFHPAYQNGVAETRRQLDVVYPPQPLRDPLEQFGYQIGKPGIISLVIESNPKPRIEWAVAGQIIKEGFSDSTGGITAQAIKEIGQGRYEVNLGMAAVQKEDTEREYILIAQNNMGRHTYKVRISTSPEPEGLEMGLGSIIGIVVAICILLVAVFLLIFAKTTGRWCFSGVRGRHLGESSDTESAEAHPKDHIRNLIPIKLTQYFKKSKNNNEPIQNGEEEDEPSNKSGGEMIDDPTKVTLDTTLATECEDDKNKGNEKEGVVYAELDLISPAGAKNVKPVVKNDNEKTEYAEIFYTPKDDENKK